jgi:peptide/nickel transport system permease protein
MPSFWKGFCRNPAAVVGLFILLGVAVLSSLGPYFYPDSPWQMAGTPMLPPFTAHGLPFGTDMLGRDIAAGIVHGSRVSLFVGTASTLVACGIGIIFGALAGFYGGLIDEALMRVTEFFQTLPTFVLAVVLVAIFQPSLASTIAAIAAVSWPPVARLVRSECLSLRNREFVQAAVAIGARNTAIIIAEILPNALSPIIVTASLMVANAILIESSISFLGLGDPSQMSWGFMIGVGRSMIRQAWWVSFFPGIAIVLTTLAINLVGEGLNDALHPRLGRR